MSPTHVYGAAGTHDVTLTVTDESANQTAVTKKVTADDTGLFSHFRTRKDDSNPLKMFFNGDYSHDANGNPVVYKQWNFGDGYTDTEGSPPSAGNYDWLLTTNAIRIGPNWAKAGVWYGGVKGIPNFPVGVTVNTLGTNAATNTTLIQNAINSCADYHAVYLSQTGTFPINQLTLKSRCILRGSGMGLTILTRTGDQASITTTEPPSIYDAYTNITSGYTAGSTSIVVSSSSGFAIGQLCLIDQTNNPDYASAGSCGYCGRYNDGATDSTARDQRESVYITNIVGNTITLDRGLNWTYSAGLTPQLVRCSATLPTIYAGVEDMTVQCITDSAAMWTDNVRFEVSVYCWVKNVELINAGRHNVAFMFNCYGCEERRCYTHDGHNFDSDRAYGTWLYYGATNCLVEDNEYYYLHQPIDLEASGPGNVLAYNYSLRTHLYSPDWYISNFATHGANCFLHLWEGNVGGQIMFDYEHGSGSHGMIFRNRLDRLDPNEPITDNIQCLILYEWNYYHSAIGNVLGTSGMGGVFELNDTYNRGTPCVMRINIDNGSKTKNTLLREGNYDFVNNATMWSASAKDIPDSLYLSAKPSWWDASPWPPYAPEKGGFNPNYLNKIPAQTRFEAR